MPHVVKNLPQQIFASPILIVDDMEINRLFLERTLRSCGFTSLMMVASAEEALENIESFQPELIILDVIMPQGMNGFTCCETIRRQEKYADLPILMQTSLTEPELRVQA